MQSCLLPEDMEQVGNPMASDGDGDSNPTADPEATLHEDPKSPSLLKNAMEKLCGSRDSEQADQGNSAAVQAPANFHQAAAVYLLGGSTANYTGCKPENVSRCTNAEMRTHWEAAEGKIGKNEKLVCHFTNQGFAGLILGVDSIGFRASVAGQGGGGFYVNAVGPHDLEWDQYQGGNFRAKVGRELWGEKAAEVLEGGPYEGNLDVVFLIKVHESQLEAAIKVPGRDVIRVIPPDLLVEQHGYHWLPKEKIVKAFILKKDVSEIEINGLEMKEEEASVKLGFGLAAVALVLLQLAAVSAILLDIVYPGCATQADCDSRPGTYCDSILLNSAGTPTSRDGSGRCLYCGEIAEYPYYGLAVPEELPANEDAFPPDCSCPDPSRHICHACGNRNEGVFCDIDSDCTCDTAVCDDAQLAANYTCTIPATSASPGQSCVSETGYTKSYTTDDRDANPAPIPRAKLLGRLVPNVIAREFCEDQKNWRPEFCDPHVAATVAELKNNNINAPTHNCSHPACRGCLPVHRELEHSTWAQWFSGWEHISKYDVVARNLQNPGSNNGWRCWPAFIAAILMVALPVSDQLASIYATMRAVTQFGDDGDAATMALVLLLSWIRFTVIAPALVMIVPLSALFVGFEAKVMFVHAIVALFVLKLETELFQFVLPDSMRADVERFGRVQVSEAQAKLDESSKLIAIVGFCMAPLVAPLLLVESGSGSMEVKNHTGNYFIEIWMNVSMWTSLVAMAKADKLKNQELKRSMRASTSANRASATLAFQLFIAAFSWSYALTTFWMFDPFGTHLDLYGVANVHVVCLPLGWSAVALLLWAIVRVRRAK